MSKIMLVNVTHVEESRVAILENGVLEAYEIETLNRANIKGNMYNAVVENVHGSLEAAFLRLGPDLKGFLPLDEVNFRLLPVRGERGKFGRIGQHLHAGQKILAQVVREPFSGKPPTVSTYFSLPGRYLVLMPGVDSDGISRKIEDQEQRDKLKKVIEELNAPEGFGVIVRTAGVGQSRTELQRDLRYLLRLWESIKRASAIADFPGLVYRERDLVIRTMRDYFTSDISEVWIDNPETYERALEFVRDVMPGKAKVLHLYTGDRPLFSKYNLEDQIESIYQRQVPLPSGGEIIIDGTEALTAIDVNSARSARKGDPEETVLQTNLEAASEIGRQMRLRDLGGLLVVDFIDMSAARNRGKVEKAMRDAMKGDRAKYDVTKISKLGLLEIARQRIRAEKMGASYATCPTCDGYGLVKNVEPAALAALRKLQVRCTRGDFGKMRVTLPPEVAGWILNNKREDLLQLERRQNIRILIEAKSSLLRHECEFETAAREKIEAPPALVAPDRPLPPLPPDAAEVAEVTAMEVRSELRIQPAAIENGDPDDEREGETTSEDGTDAGHGRKRRRRRRRRGRAETGQPQESGELTIREFDGEPARPVVAEGAAGSVLLPEPAATIPIQADDALPGVVQPAQDGTTVLDESAPQGGRKRRRRRRRRGKGGPVTGTQPGAAQPPAQAQANNDQDDDRFVGGGGDGDDTDDDGPVEFEESLVPQSVRSEELLPAATGGRRPRSRPPGGGRGGGGGGRRRGSGA